MMMPGEERKNEKKRKYFEVFSALLTYFLSNQRVDYQ